jgi:hypothetical protein
VEPWIRRRWLEDGVLHEDKAVEIAREQLGRRTEYKNVLIPKPSFVLLFFSGGSLPHLLGQIDSEAIWLALQAAGTRGIVALCSPFGLVRPPRLVSGTSGEDGENSWTQYVIPLAVASSKIDEDERLDGRK